MAQGRIARRLTGAATEGNLRRAGWKRSRQPIHARAHSSLQVADAPGYPGYPVVALLRFLSVRITSCMNAGRSMGQREVMRLPSTTTFSST